MRRLSQNSAGLTLGLFLSVLVAASFCAAPLQGGFASTVQMGGCPVSDASFGSDPDEAADCFLDRVVHTEASAFFKPLPNGDQAIVVDAFFQNYSESAPTVTPNPAPPRAPLFLLNRALLI